MTRFVVDRGCVMFRPGRVLVVSVVALAGCTGAGPPDPPRSDGATPAASSASADCRSRVATGPLPEWADAGFHGDTRVPHVLGARGDIVAILFGHPLTHGRREGPANKVLWVARPAPGATDPAASADLMITATRDGTDTPVTREVAGGPGPSIVDLPAPGCWHLRLAWSGRVDTMDLTYRSGAG
ncbi:hypothetical protein [Micromonospora maritima]|uniref:DUF4871 domain-containing protein n=1 Tax=Micromonospora maritima TaxID=986711 RepID=A0ABW7ZIQ7_9ACTN